MTTTRMATGDAIRRRQRRRRWRDDDDDNDDDPHRENFECDCATGNEVNVDGEQQRNVDGEQQRRWRLV